jgi:NitT/TauT family transport system substrate-binding protein
MKTGWSWRVMVALVAIVGVVAAGCSNKSSPGTESATGTTTKVKIILGWVASPQFGGFFAAQQLGYYQDAGLDVTLQGGEVESPIQVVAGGGAQFGFGDADEILQARSQGIPIVGVFPTFSKALRILVYHQEHPISSFDQLDGRDVYVDLGDAWWQYIVSKFKLTSAGERSYNQQAFLRDDSAVIQGYAGDQLELAGADPTAKLGVINVADSGWNPYMQVLFASESYAAEHADTIKAFIEASVKGWNYYRGHANEVDVYMQDHGAEAAPEVMDEQAKLYEEYIFEGGFPAQMTADRWRDTLDALKLTGVLKEDVDVSKAFTNDFLAS